MYIDMKNTNETTDIADRDCVKVYNGGSMSAIPNLESLQLWISRKPTAAKSYASFYRAHKVAETLSKEVASIHETAEPALYTLIQYEDRWYPVIFVNELIARPEAVGGYVAHVAAQGFMQA